MWETEPPVQTTHTVQGVADQTLEQLCSTGGQKINILKCKLPN